MKFQTFTAASLVSKETPKVKYQEVTTDKAESHYEMIEKLELDHEGAPVTIQQLTGDERSVEFLLHEDEASWE